MKYRRRTFEVEAVQFVAGKPKSVKEFLGDQFRPIKFGNRIDGVDCALLPRPRFPPIIPERRNAWNGDWIVRLNSGWAVYTDSEFRMEFENAV